MYLTWICVWNNRKWTGGNGNKFSIWKRLSKKREIKERKLFRKRCVIYLIVWRPLIHTVSHFSFLDWIFFIVHTGGMVTTVTAFQKLFYNLCHPVQWSSEFQGIKYRIIYSFKIPYFHLLIWNKLAKITGSLNGTKSVT